MDKRLKLNAGPIISHYEFKQPMQEGSRLRNGGMLKTNPPDAPAWTSSFEEE